MSLEVTWHGHACFEVRGSKALVFDPHDGKSIGIPAPSASADVLFVSHEHFDHSAVRSIQGDPRVIAEPIDGRVDGLSVRTYVLPHDASAGARRGMVRAYRAQMDGVSILFLGDVGDLPPEEVVAKEGNISLLFLPVGGVFTIGPEEGVRWVEALQPRVAIPMHYRVGGISLSIKPVEEFLDLVPWKVLKVGHAVSFMPEDLDGGPEVWVFSL